jgi:hypothetical protein
MSTSLDGPAFASCSLDAQQRRLRADEFAALLVPNLVDLERRPEGLTLALDLDADTLHQLTQLLGRERECCSFWRFALAPVGSGPARLSVEVTSGHEPALEALAALVDGRLR